MVVLLLLVVQSAMLVTSLTLPMLRPRSVCVDERMHLTIYEVADPRSLVEEYNSRWTSPVEEQVEEEASSDPFGVVLWPGAHVAARLLCRMPIAGRNILVLGAGTGLEALAAARLGAKRVIACDVNELTNGILQHAAAQAGLEDVIEVRHFDLLSAAPLPASDVCVYSDTFYTSELARRVASRCRASLELPSPPDLIVTDSQKYASGNDFLSALNRGLQEPFEWSFEALTVTGSGILVEEDVTSDVNVRYICHSGPRR